MSPAAVSYLWAFLSFITLLALYIYTNDRKITRLPNNWESFTTKTRCTPDQVRATGKQLAEHPPTIDNQLPPKTGRRYIVVGGVCPFIPFHLKAFSLTTVGRFSRWLDRYTIIRQRGRPCMYPSSRYPSTSEQSPTKHSQTWRTIHTCRCFLLLFCPFGLLHTMAIFHRRKHRNYHLSHCSYHPLL